MERPSLTSRMRLGFLVFGVLMTIEIIEYLVGTVFTQGAWPYLGLLAVVGAWPIIRYFMHITQLWHPEE
ncbi:MAG TPA: hypothetical protein VNP04_03895 [Alphaproteobacteria bacterium]|nr:hypothetical protein [Alphaproteobacteria bacterium]